MATSVYRLPMRSCLDKSSFLVLGIAILAITTAFWYPLAGVSTDSPGAHPIDTLIQKGNEKLEALLATQARSYAEAVAAYRKRRGQEPPPGFAQWYAAAAAHNATVVEAFWDQVQTDVGRYRGTPPAVLRAQARVLAGFGGRRPLAGLRVRGGILAADDCGSDDGTCLNLRDLVGAALVLADPRGFRLPDLDLPLYLHASPFAFVPHARARPDRNAARPPGHPSLEADLLPSLRDRLEAAFGTGRCRADEEPSDEAVDFTARVLAACPPTSDEEPALSANPSFEGWSDSMTARIRVWREESKKKATGKGERLVFADHDGAAAEDICARPWTAYLHGATSMPRPPCGRDATLRGPRALAAATSSELLPVFSATQIRGLSQTLTLPADLYWRDERGLYRLPWAKDDGDDDDGRMAPMLPSWDAKRNQAVWRGSNTGGAHDAGNWHRFHRHRFVALTNASYLDQALASGHRDRAGASPPARRFPDWALAAALHDGTAATSHHATCPSSDFFRRYVDTGFSQFNCRDDQYRGAPTCSYLDGSFRAVAPVGWADMLARYRYVFDVDGNSFSARFRALLLSNSVVLKATIFTEWHSARLVPWVHYVPLAIDFGPDLRASLEYFVGDCGGRGGHEAEARKFAAAARSWAEQVLRPVDMELYVLRLLLEWGRLVGTPGSGESGESQ